MDDGLGLGLRHLDVEHLGERWPVDGHNHRAIARVIENLWLGGHPLQIRVDGQTQALRLAALNLEAVDVGPALRHGKEVLLAVAVLGEIAHPQPFGHIVAVGVIVVARQTRNHAV